MFSPLSPSASSSTRETSRSGTPRRSADSIATSIAASAPVRWPTARVSRVIGFGAAVAARRQRHRNGRGMQQGVGHAAHGVALEQAGAGGAHHDQAGLVFDGGIDEAGGERVGLADMEPGLESFGDEGHALAFRGEHLLLRGADTVSLRVHRHVGRLAGPPHRPGQGARPGRGPWPRPGQRRRRRVRWVYSQLRIACMNPLWVCGRSQLCSGGSGRRRPVCVPAVVGTTLAQRRPECRNSR